MSPRSQEFMEGARERLASARDQLATDHPVCPVETGIPSSPDFA